MNILGGSFQESLKLHGNIADVRKAFPRIVRPHVEEPSFLDEPEESRVVLSEPGAPDGCGARQAPHASGTVFGADNLFHENFAAAVKCVGLKISVARRRVALAADVFAGGE